MTTGEQIEQLETRLSGLGRHEAMEKQKLLMQIQLLRLKEQVTKAA